jgi:AcrR family transcriptional regulator
MTRRDRILAAATSLFAERGYASTGVDEIAAAAGITGGGVYRHFPSKLDVFRGVLEPMVRHRASRLAAIVDEARSPDETLRLMIENLVDGVLDDRSLTAALWRELRHLDVEGRTWFDRIHAFHTREFVRSLRALRPDLSKREAEARTQACFGVAFTAAELESGLSRDELRALLIGIALDVLLC